MSRGRTASRTRPQIRRPKTTLLTHPSRELGISAREWRRSDHAGTAVHVQADLPASLEPALGGLIEDWPEAWRGCVEGVWLTTAVSPEQAERIAGVFDQSSRAMTIIGRQVGPKAYSFQLADPLVTDHEFAHAMEDHLPGGPSVFAARWREAQAADAFRGLAFESHREPGVDVLVGDLWVAGPAKKVKRVSEDWAEAYSLLRREQRGTPLISSQPERRFDQVYPSRAKLLAEVLRSTPWFPPAG